MTPRTVQEEILNSFIDRCLQDMRPEQAAIVDALLMMQLARRIPSMDLKLEMRLVAEKHRQKAPYLAHALRALADSLAASSAVLPFTPQTAKPQEHTDAPKRH